MIAIRDTMSMNVLRLNGDDQLKADVVVENNYSHETACLPGGTWGQKFSILKAFKKEFASQSNHKCMKHQMAEAHRCAFFSHASFCVRIASAFVCAAPL